MTTFLNPSGLSTVGQDYFKCFSSYGIRVIPLWLGPPEMGEAIDKTIVEEMLSASNRPIEDGALQFHAGRADDCKLLKTKSIAVGSIVLEGNRLQSEHITICRALDVVAAPSYFCRNVCMSSGIPKNKIAMLPYALDVKTWNPNVKPTLAPNGRYRFLYMNSCYERKGWDLLLHAYWKEFSADDPVELTIKSYREQDRMESLEVLVALEAEKLGIDRNKRAPVKIIDSVMPAQEIPGFMKSFDAFVSPHRSEGFGLSIWHAMALGVPAIATDYGGNTDFTKADTSWLIRVKEMTQPSEKEVKIFKHYRGITWAEPDLQDLRRQMKACMMNRDEAQKRATAGAKLVAKNYGYEKILQDFERLLPKDVWAKLCSTRYIESLAKQPTERFESVEKPFKMLEL